MGNFGGPKVRFEVIGEAWELFKAQPGLYLLGILPLFGLVGVAYFFYILYYLSIMGKSDIGTLLTSFLVGFVFAVFVQSLVIFFTASFVKVMIKQIRGQAPSASDFFDYEGRAGQLFAVAIIVSLLYTIGSYLCLIPGLLAGGLSLLAGPLVLIQGKEPLEALKLSWNTLKPQIWQAAGLLFVVGFVQGLGVLVCCVGILATFPIGFLSLAGVYADYFVRPSMIPPVVTGNMPPPPVVPPSEGPNP